MSAEMPGTIDLVRTEWTKKPYKSYFGKNYYTEHRILINRILKSHNLSI